MTSKHFAGGTYGEGLPTGEFAVAFTDHIETHFGRVNLPGEPLLFLRVTNVPHFKMAGQGNFSGRAWEWDNGWVDRGTTFGVSPLIYDNGGVLRLATVADGSQGFRYVTADNRLVTGDQTYRHPVLPLWEYTVLEDGTPIGQGEDGCRTVVGGKLRYLTTGDARFIRVRESGDTIGVTIVSLAGGWTDIYTLTRQELGGLPEVVIVPPPPPPPPTENKMLETIRQIRARYGTPLGAKHGRFLNEVCLALGAKMFEKNGGAHTTLPNGKNVSLDIIILGGEWVDILGDADGAATPTWDPHPNATGTFVEPLPMSAFDPPIDPPPPPPPPTDGGLIARVAKLEQQASDLAGMLASMKDTIASLDEYRKVLVTQVAKLSTEKLTVSGTTGRSFAHSHSVDLEVKRG